MTKRILNVVTNVAHYEDPSELTGLWLSELTHAYHVFAEAGYDQTIVSPKGGLSPLEPRSLKFPNYHKSAKAWKADDAKIEISGAADFEGYDFLIKKADIDIAGAAATKINVTDFLRIDADGPCDIRYKGTPRIDQDLSVLSHMEHED